MRQLRRVSVRVHTMQEWLDLLQHQIERAQEPNPELAFELSAIHDAMYDAGALPGSMADQLGAAALAARSLAVSTANKKNANKPRGTDEDVRAARAAFDAWGGAAMTPEKRRECELHVAHELGTSRPKITRWFAYFIEHPDLS
ncbi:hypothetical protein M3A49_26670 [Paraburkholderia sp. CNPSo 3076]|nr:hypothetical protein [Paraburkholderia sp. CNPSo 3076]